MEYRYGSHTVYKIQYLIWNITLNPRAMIQQDGDINGSCDPYPYFSRYI